MNVFTIFEWGYVEEELGDFKNKTRKIKSLSPSGALPILFYFPFSPPNRREK